MTNLSNKPITISQYIEAAPEHAREKLHELWTLLKEMAPDAKEAIKWGMPVLIGKRIYFSFSAYKNHMVFMPTRSSLAPFQKELSDFTIGKDTIQFPYDKPLPKALIKKIASYRIKEVEEKGALWMHQS